MYYGLETLEFLGIWLLIAVLMDCLLCSCIAYAYVDGRELRNETTGESKHMSETFTNRNGVTEQMRFYRQQPRHLVNLQFDFEENRQLKNKLDAVIFWVAFIAVVVSYVVFYTWQ